MFEKVRNPFRARHMSAKAIIAYVLFGAIILVFALFGIVTPDRYGMSAGGGTAAIVNDTSITVAEFRQRVETMERNSKLPLDKLPPETRELYTREIQKRTLEQMILTEIVYQTAYKHGIWASNAQVRDEIVGIPVFQENGRFKRQRYDNFLSATGRSADEFERQIRKDIVIRRVQDLFQTANGPTSLEVDAVSDLQSRLADFRYVELTPAKLASEHAVSDSEVAAYSKDPAHAAEIKKYFDQHALDYSLPERVKARHILLLVDEKHPDKEVAAKAKALRARVNPRNFAAIALKESQDTGSAKKGGELGYFQKGRMVPQFEAAAFKMKVGEISEPIKTEFGYHIIYVEAHDQARKVSLDEARPGIARKLLAQEKEPQDLADLKKAVDSGKVSEVDSRLKKFGLGWEKAENVNLASPQLRLQDASEVLEAVAKRQGKSGLIPGLVGRGRQYVVDVVAWKKNPKPVSKDDLSRNLAFEESDDAFEGWVRDAEKKATVSRNPKLFQR